MLADQFGTALVVVVGVVGQHADGLAVAFVPDGSSAGAGHGAGDVEAVAPDGVRTWSPRRDQALFGRAGRGGEDAGRPSAGLLHRLRERHGSLPLRLRVPG
ncbi:hypothetical protein [Amycolatopsis sp. NPDC051903]|uniref:hypothetical protein n=1 Tax=Amycolatopsis sp. NPDC051903 TaxID=3363936 RepID=UPI0037A149F3